MEYNDEHGTLDPWNDARVVTARGRIVPAVILRMSGSTADLDVDVGGTRPQRMQGVKYDPAANRPDTWHVRPGQPEPVFPPVRDLGGPLLTPPGPLPSHLSPPPA